MGYLTVSVEANLATTVWTDLTVDTRQEPGITLDWGMDGGRPEDNCARPGTCNLTLDNETRTNGLRGRYSPGHTNALAGFDLNTPLRVILQDGPNRCVNGGMETGTAAEWTTYDGAGEVTAFGQTAATSHSGTMSCKIEWTGGNDAKGIRPVAGVGNLPFSPYTTYVVSCWARMLTASTPFLYLGWVGTAPATSVLIGATNLSTVWQRFAWVITWGATVNATVGDFVFWLNNTGTHTIYFDDIQVERAASITDWHDSAHRICGPYRIAEITPTPGQYLERQVGVLATDWLEEAAEAPIQTSAMIRVDAPTLIGTLIASMDRQPTATELDAGIGIFEYPLRDMTGPNNRVLAAFKETAQSDGGFVYLTSDGTLRYESRNSRAGNTTDDFTLSDTMHGLEAQRSRDALVNFFNLTTHPPVLSSGYVVLCEILTPWLIQGGQTVTLTLDYRDPDTGEPCGGVLTQPLSVALGDWTANSQENGFGTDYTGNSNLVIGYGSSTGVPGTSNVIFQVHSNFAVGTDVYITTLRQRGIAVLDRDPVTVAAVNATSITAYGRKTVDVDLPYQSDSNFATGLAEYWKSIYSDAAMRASAVFVRAAADATPLAMVLSADIGTRIRLTETMTGIGESYWVQGVALTVVAGMLADMTLRLAPAVDDLFFVLDASELDNLTRKLGY